MNYCISDIHGHYDLFCRLMEKIKFCASDRLIVLGDMVDKGADSIRLVKLLFSMPNVSCLAGNHEYDFLKFYHSLMKQTEDYDAVLHKCRNYFADGNLLDWDVIDRLEFLPFYEERDNFIAVHAGLPVEKGVKVPLNKVRAEQLVYDRAFKDKEFVLQGEKCVIYGHTPVRWLTGRDEILKYPRDGKKSDSGNIEDFFKVHIDTGVYLGGTLGCICTDDCRCFYVTDKGK